jgi:hypothetical protein
MTSHLSHFKFGESLNSFSLTFFLSSSSFIYALLFICLICLTITRFSSSSYSIITFILFFSIILSISLFISIYFLLLTLLFALSCSNLMRCSLMCNMRFLIFYSSSTTLNCSFFLLASSRL